MHIHCTEFNYIFIDNSFLQNISGFQNEILHTEAAVYIIWYRNIIRYYKKNIIWYYKYFWNGAREYLKGQGAFWVEGGREGVMKVVKVPALPNILTTLASEQQTPRRFWTRIKPESRQTSAAAGEGQFP